MFRESAFNKDISNWNTESLTHAEYMFYDCDFTGDISEWNLSNLEHCEYMFFNDEYDQDLSELDINPGVYFDGMFRSCSISKEHMPKMMQNDVRCR